MVIPSPTPMTVEIAKNHKNYFQMALTRARHRLERQSIDQFAIPNSLPFESSTYLLRKNRPSKRESGAKTNPLLQHLAPIPLHPHRDIHIDAH